MSDSPVLGAALAGKRAWVTGASGGLGGAIATAMRDAGAEVVGTASRASGDLEGCDIGDPAAIAAFIDRQWAEHGGVDILVNCAGITVRKPILEVEVDEWDRVFDVNVRGSFLCAQGVARRWVDEGRAGSIVNVGSINAWVAHAETVPYAATKGALQSLTYGLAVALGPHGIRVNAVAPGTIPTAFNAARFDVDGAREKATATVPLGRLGVPEEVAPAVVFLASELSAYTTGAVLAVHGGKTLIA